ncbi:NAD(P)-binding protein [Hyaloscypha variabilis]
MKPPYPAPVTEWHNDTYDAINPKRPELSQDGRTIVITGAGSGIGREIAHAFAEAGAESIHILGRRKSLLEETQALVEAKHMNAKVIVYVADILDAAALDQAARKIGSWDVLVANAGYIPKPELIETGDSDDWWKTFEINIKGNYLLTRAFLPYKKTGSTIVANSSGFAFLPPGLPFLAKNSAYSTSKLGTARFYEFLAVEHPDLNIFILQPGVVRTALYTKGELTLDDTLDTIQLPAHFTGLATITNFRYR